MEADLRRLRIFLAVVDTLHFGRAARQLRLAQPSISQQIARLEREVGSALFTRTPRGVTLTSAGHRLAQAIGPPVRALDAALAAFAACDSPVGRLRIGALPSLAASLIPSALPDGTATGSEVSIAEGPLAQLLRRLCHDDIDVVFCYSTSDSTALDGCLVQCLDVRASQVALPASDPLAGHREIPWAEAATRPWIVPTASRQYYEDMLERFTSRDLGFRVVAEATALPGQLALVAAGIGWTFTSPWSPAPPGIWLAELAGADRIELLAVTRTAGATGAVQSLIDAVKAHATAVR